MSFVINVLSCLRVHGCANRFNVNHFEGSGDLLRRHHENRASQVLAPRRPSGTCSGPIIMTACAKPSIGSSAMRAFARTRHSTASGPNSLFNFDATLPANRSCLLYTSYTHLRAHET